MKQENWVDELKKSYGNKERFEEMEWLEDDDSYDVWNFKDSGVDYVAIPLSSICMFDDKGKNIFIDSSDDTCLICECFDGCIKEILSGVKIGRDGYVCSSEYYYSSDYSYENYFDFFRNLEDESMIEWPLFISDDLSIFPCIKKGTVFDREKELDIVRTEYVEHTLPKKDEIIKKLNDAKEKSLDNAKNVVESMKAKAQIDAEFDNAIFDYEKNHKVK